MITLILYELTNLAQVQICYIRVRVEVSDKKCLPDALVV